jgi:hypothetical protein
VDAAAIIEIHQLLGYYGHLVDAAAWDRFEELFTPHAVLDYTAVRAPRVMHGIDELREYFRGANHPSAHHVTNIVVREADGVVRGEEQVLRPVHPAVARAEALVRRRLRRRRGADATGVAVQHAHVHRAVAARG